jgi:hypothetical protein
VNPDAEIDVLVRQDTGVRLGQSALRLHRALHRLNRAPKLREDTIARRVGYAAPVVPNEPVEDRPAFGQPFERAGMSKACRKPAIRGFEPR